MSHLIFTFRCLDAFIVDFPSGKRLRIASRQFKSMTSRAKPPYYVPAVSIEPDREGPLLDSEDSSSEDDFMHSRFNEHLEESTSRESLPGSVHACPLCEKVIASLQFVLLE